MANDDFGSKYTNANLQADAKPYDAQYFKQVLADLENVDNGKVKAIAPAVLAGMLCSMRRGDAVPKLFATVTEHMSNEETKKVYASFSEAITIVFCFAGLPNCIPACLGLVAELRSRSIDGSSEPNRPSITEEDWDKTGAATHRDIYRAVGNAEVGDMISEYFPDLGYLSRLAIFGYAIGGSLRQQSLPESELILAGAITALGATRQSRSHCKAALGVGNSVETVQTLIDSSIKLAEWNTSRPPVRLNAVELKAEVDSNLAKQA